eukprot:358344-Chlamydomonas_euryale.AAC.14
MRACSSVVGVTRGSSGAGAVAVAVAPTAASQGPVPTASVDTASGAVAADARSAPPRAPCMHTAGCLCEMPGGAVVRFAAQTAIALCHSHPDATSVGQAVAGCVTRERPAATVAVGAAHLHGSPTFDSHSHLARGDKCEVGAAAVRADAGAHVLCLNSHAHLCMRVAYDCVKNKTTAGGGRPTGVNRGRSSTPTSACALHVSALQCWPTQVAAPKCESGGGAAQLSAHLGQ